MVSNFRGRSVSAEPTSQKLTRYLARIDSGNRIRCGYVSATFAYACESEIHGHIAIRMFVVPPRVSSADIPVRTIAGTRRRDSWWGMQTGEPADPRRGMLDHGRLTKSEVFWHLDSYSTRVAAQADKGPRSAIIEALGKVWLMTIEDEKWRPVHGNRIAEIGPIPIIAGENYSAQYMEAIFAPGMTAPAHLHSGPEAWYTVAGETCLETSDGRVQVGRAGESPVIVPIGLSMHLTATGTEQRRALVLILHQSSMAPTMLVHDWTPKGLCKSKN